MLGEPNYFGVVWSSEGSNDDHDVHDSRLTSHDFTSDTGGNGGRSENWCSEVRNGRAQSRLLTYQSYHSLQLLVHWTLWTVWTLGSRHSRADCSSSQVVTYRATAS